MLTQVLSLDSLNTEQLKKLSVLDIHLAILNNEEESIPDLVKKLPAKKLNSLIDISAWDRDNFNAQNFSFWIKNILSLEYEDSYTQINKLDHQELVLFLSNTVNINWYDKDEIYPENPILTDDFAFLIRPNNLNYDDELFNVAATIIKNAYLNDFAMGRKLCLETMGLTYSLQEEECFRNKNIRLSEEGVPSFEEAMKLYFYENPSILLKKILKYVDQSQYKKHKPDSSYIISEHTVVSKDYFDKNFSDISKELEDIIKIELSNLITASIVVNNALNKDTKHVLGIIERSINYYSLGVELIKDSIAIDNTKILTYIPLKEIFRLGFSLLIDMKRNANKLQVLINEFEDKILISSDDEEFLNNLLLPIPRYFINFETKVYDFTSLSKLKEARVRLSELAKKILKV